MQEDPDTLVDLTAARSEFEASVMVEALKARGIPAFTFSNAGMTLQWEVAATQPFRVSVRRRDVAAAKEVLRAVRADSVDIDWSEVDVGRSPEESDNRQLGDPPQLFLIRWLSGWGGPILIIVVLLWLLWNAVTRPAP